MFCPNCASKNEPTQHFCRTCGLKLDAIAAEMATQRPSEEFALLLKRKRLFERLGVLCLSTAGLIGFFLLLSKVFYEKLKIFGPDLLFGSASIALLVFAIASIFFFNYPKLVMKMDRVNSRLPVDQDQGSIEPLTTNKLLTDPPFEHASVTEHSTELLRTPKK